MSEVLKIIAVIAGGLGLSAALALFAIRTLWDRVMTQLDRQTNDLAAFSKWAAVSEERIVTTKRDLDAAHDKIREFEKWRTQTESLSR